MVIVEEEAVVTVPALTGAPVEVVEEEEDLVVAHRTANQVQHVIMEA